MLGFVRIFNCPYCPRSGEGVVAVDAEAGVRLSLTGRRNVSVRVDDGDPDGVVIFRPDGHQERPCAHVLSLLIDVEVRRPRVVAEGDQRLTYTATFDHPRFLADEYGNDLSVYLWTEVCGGDQPGYYPVTPSRVRRFERRRRLPPRRDGWEMWISSTVFLAMQPDVYLEQLEDGYERRHPIEPEQP